MRTLLRNIMLAAVALPICAAAQERRVENRPYTDLRPVHLGVLIGTHWQDIELMNAGPQTITLDDGTTQETLVTTDQDRWDMGFTVGVLAEFRLSTHFQLRVAPSMYFGNRHVVFQNFTERDDDGNPTERRQDLKTSYFATAFDLIFSAPRFNNHRPYLVTGLVPMLNLTSRDNEYLRLKKMDVYAELGVGCDFYLPFFKLRPELKFMYGLTNMLDTKHADNLRDKTMLPYAKSVNKARTKIIALTFYFE